MKVRERVRQVYDATQAIEDGADASNDVRHIRWRAGWWLISEDGQLVDAVSNEHFLEVYEVLGDRRVAVGADL